MLHDWSLPTVLESIYNFSNYWKFPPKVYRLNANAIKSEQWQEELVHNQQFVLSSQNNGLFFYFPWEEERIVDPKGVILLVEEQGQLVRQDQIKLPTGQTINLRLISPTSQNEKNTPKFTTTPIFDHLIPLGNCDYCKEVPRIYFQEQN